MCAKKASVKKPAKPKVKKPSKVDLLKLPGELHLARKYVTGDICIQDDLAIASDYRFVYVRVLKLHDFRRLVAAAKKGGWTG